MGLSGRKAKQRIPNDPRNLAWANDANKFGAAYLAKFGWDPSGGLGVSGEGRTKALSVTQKLDMLGIGADHKNSAEGLAWKQNKDFESLLRRLNAANGGGEDEETRMKIDGFTKSADMTAIEAQRTEMPAGGDGDDAGATEVGGSKKKRRKEKDDGEEGERRKKKFKKKRSSDDNWDAQCETKTEEKKSKKPGVEMEAEISTPLDTKTSSPAPTPTSGPVPRSRHPRAAFRARHMAAKSRASTSSAALAEILGIADSGSATPVTPSSMPTSYPPTPFEVVPSTSSSDPSGAATPAEEIKLQELTVSNKSVMDYFKEKLAAKSRPASSPSTPAEEVDDYDDRPRMGLGSSRLRQEVSVEAEERGGFGGIGSRNRLSFVSMFASATATGSAEVVAEADAEVEAEVDEVGVGETMMKRPKDKEKERKKEKKSKKEERKEKELDGAENVEESDTASDEKAERKRWKEGKRRRKETDTRTSASPDGGDPPSLECTERKGKSKKKGKADR